MRSSRKYPYLPHRTPQPSGNSNKASHISLRGGIGIFGFAVLDIFLNGFSVVSKDIDFSVLVFNAVCGFFVF